MQSLISKTCRKILFRSRKKSAVRLKISTQSPIVVCKDEKEK